MSYLSDHMIRWMSETKGLIAPFDEAQLQPASYDCRLAPTILVPHLRNVGPIDTRKPADEYTDSVDISDGYLLTQGACVLGSTIERVMIPNDVVGRVEGKSSRAREWIQIHSAGYLDPGFRGNVTLEIVCQDRRPVLLYPGILIAQLAFAFLQSACERPYSGRYQDSVGTVASRSGHDPHPL